jgi:hypothetical protein
MKDFLKGYLEKMNWVKIGLGRSSFQNWVKIGLGRSSFQDCLGRRV